MSNRQPLSPSSVTRRRLLQVAAGAVGTLALPEAVRAAAGEGEKAATKGNIVHSVVTWCFEPHWSFDELCKNARQLGCRSVELCPPSVWPTVKKYGLTCAIAPSHLFVQGMNNPKYQAGCLEMLRQRIDQCADAGTKTVITFTGYAQESGAWADGTNPDLSKLPPNRKVKLLVNRKDKPLELEATLGRSPGSLPFDNWGGGPFSDRRWGFAAVIPHDLAIAPTDCGGPLVDIDGRCQGVNIARALRVANYALPPREVQQAIERIRAAAKSQ